MVGKPLPEDAVEEIQFELTRAVKEHTGIGEPTADDDRLPDRSFRSRRGGVGDERPMMVVASTNWRCGGDEAFHVLIS
jgi:hypothetical protein